MIWVDVSFTGTNPARVENHGRLKAELRIPGETQANNIRLSRQVSVDSDWLRRDVDVTLEGIREMFGKSCTLSVTVL